MKCFITLGKIDIKYIILISLAIGTFFGIAHSFSLYSKNKSKFYDKYKENNKLLKSFMKFLGMTYLIFGEIIRKKIIYKKGEKPLNNLIKIKDIIFISIVCFLFLLGECLAVFLKIKKNRAIALDERYNSIEFIFLFLISLIVFKVRYYKHQYISILLIIILEIIRYIIKSTDNNSSNDKKNKKKDINPWLEFFLQIVRASIDAIFIGYSKLLMEVKFFSPYKVTYIFGLISLVIILICYLILSFISVKGTNSYCFINYKEKCYIENLFSIFCDFTFLQFLGLFLLSILQGMYQFVYNFIIKDYTMCHFFLYYQFYSLYSNIRRKSSNNLILSFVIIFCILEFFITFVFLELIQLNFCGLNKDIKFNIEKRTLLETYETDSQKENRNSVVYNDNDYITKYDE